MILSDDTVKLLEDIENRIDPETEDDFRQQWVDFSYDRFEGDIFSPYRKTISPPAPELKRISVNEAIDDYELMLTDQLNGVNGCLHNRTPCLGVRANYGSAIMTSLFGAEIFMMPPETGTLPTTYSFHDSNIIREILERGIPDLNNGFGRKVLEMGEIFAEVFSRYPKIQKYVRVYHPDTQGPLDICELLWGEELFYAMYDDEELVHSILDLITRTYIAFMEKWFAIFPAEPELETHWSIMQRGGIMLRNDSAMNLSPEMYREFVMPCDQKLLDHFGGGIMHFCGRGDHYIPEAVKMRGLYGINMSQPEYNDMEIIYQNTVDRGLKILGFSGRQALQDKNRPGGFHGCMNCAL